MAAEKRISPDELMGLLGRAGLSVEGLRRLAAECNGGGCQSGCSKECSMKCITCYNGGSTGGIAPWGPGRGDLLERIVEQLKSISSAA